MVWDFSYILAPCLESCMYFLLFEAFLIRKKNLPNYMLFVGWAILALFIYLSNKLFLYSFFNLIVMAGMALIVAQLLYDNSLLKKGAVAVGCLMISCTTEGFVMAMLAYLLNIESEIAATSEIFRFWGIIFSKGLGLALCNIIRINLKKRSEELSRAYWLLFFLLFSIIGTAAFLIFRFAFDSTDQSYNGMVVVCGIGLIVLIFLVLYLYERLVRQLAVIHEKEQSELYLSTQLKHLEDLMVKQKELRQFRHDLSNQMTVLEGYLKNGDVSGGYQYMRTLRRTLDDADFSLNTGNIAFDSILSTKKTLAESKGIQFSMTVQIPEKLYIKPMDQCIIFGNALDNAIEACERSSKNNKKIDFFLIQKKDKLLCQIINTVALNEGRDLTTSKKDKENHGLGLLNLSSTLAKYDSEPFIEQSDEAFILSFIIYIT